MMIKENSTKSCDPVMFEHFIFHITFQLPHISLTIHVVYQKEMLTVLEVCSCSRKLNVGENVCSICANSEIIKAAENGEISENILHILKPIQSHECQLRFPDQIRYDGHIRTVHQRNITPCHLDVRTFTLKEVKMMLSERGLTTEGNKKHLCDILENTLAMEFWLVRNRSYYIGQHYKIKTLIKINL